MRSNKFIIISIVLALAGYGCAPSFSELQSAKLVDKGHFEAAANYSSVSFHNEGESEKAQDHFGIQIAYGLMDKVNLRFRYERIEVDPVEVSANVFGFGPKLRIVEDVFALYLPVGFATGEDIETSESWQFHPTIILTYPYREYFELNTSAKYIIQFCDDCDQLVGLNVGLGLSHDLRIYAIRPELGFLINPGEDGHYMHYSIGVSTFF